VLKAGQSTNEKVTLIRETSSAVTGTRKVGSVPVRFGYPNRTGTEIILSTFGSGTRTGTRIKKFFRFRFGYPNRKYSGTRK
jgi:hypothetical protein